MANALKIASGILKGAVGCAAFGCGVAINGAFKAVSGVGLPPYEGSPVQEAKELSRYWFELAKEDFDEA